MTLAFSNQSVVQLKDDQERQHLLEVMQIENKDVLKLAEEFYAQDRFDPQTDKGFCERMIAAVERVLAAGDWGSSLFLRNTIKPLRELKQQAEELVVKINKQSGETLVMIQDNLNEGQRIVFVSLFQTEGHNMKRWALQLLSIQKHLTGRPVYVQEEQVQHAIRSSINQDSDSQAYIVIAIMDDDIEAVDSSVVKAREDRMGNELLLLKSGVVTPDHIVEFVHSKKRYRFINGRFFLQK